PIVIRIHVDRVRRSRAYRIESIMRLRRVADTDPPRRMENPPTFCAVEARNADIADTVRRRIEYELHSGCSLAIDRERALNREVFDLQGASPKLLGRGGKRHLHQRGRRQEQPAVNAMVMKIIEAREVEACFEQTRGADRLQHLRAKEGVQQGSR